MRLCWYGCLRPLDKSNDSLCHACEAVGCALDEIVAQEEVLGWESIRRARREEFCHI